MVYKTYCIVVIVSICILLSACAKSLTNSSDENLPLHEPDAIPVYVGSWNLPEYFSGMAIDENGGLLISNWMTKEILTYSSTGYLLDTWSLYLEEEVLTPMYMEYSNNRFILICACSDYSKLIAFGDDHHLQFEVPEVHEMGNGWAGGVDAIATDGEGFIYTLDFQGESVAKYSSEGEYECQWSTIGPNPGINSWASGIAVGSNNIVYISDTLNDRILMFSRTGDLLGIIGEQGTGNAQFIWPHGLATDQDDILYVVDRINKRVQKMSLTGEYICEFSTGDEDPLLITVYEDDVYIYYAGNKVGHYRYCE